MIHLRHDCLVFELPDGGLIPCSAEDIALELTLEEGQDFDPEVLKNATAAVLHYFRSELDQQEVSIQEFASALRRVLKNFGFKVAECEAAPAAAPHAFPATSSTQPPPLSAQPSHAPRSVEIDLGSLEQSSGAAGELQFYQLLKTDFQERLNARPEIIVCHGLKSCAKNLCAARRWSERCQELSDNIVEFLRACLREHSGIARPVLCVR